MVHPARAVRIPRLPGFLRELGTAGAVRYRARDRCQQCDLPAAGVRRGWAAGLSAARAASLSDDAVGRRGPGLRRRRLRHDRIHVVVTGVVMSADALMRAPIALLPVVLFLAGLVQLDGYKLVRLRMMIALLATGALAAGVSYVLNNLAFAHFHGSFVTYSRYVSPWIEESLKAALLGVLIRTRRVGLPVDAGIAGFAIGTGFAVVENLYYLAARPHTVLAVQVIRGFGTAIMHGGTAAILPTISNTLHERPPR